VTAHICFVLAYATCEGEATQQTTANPTTLLQKKQLYNDTSSESVSKQGLTSHTTHYRSLWKLVFPVNHLH